LSRQIIQVILDHAKLTSERHRALERTGARIVTASVVDATLNRDPDARLIVSADAASLLRERIDVIIAIYDADPCPTLLLSDAEWETPPHWSSAIGTRAITMATRIGADELCGRLMAMCAMKAPMDLLRRELESTRTESHRIEQQSTALQSQLQEAAAVQRSLMPMTPTDLREGHITTFYRPAEQVGGDAFDVTRLDEHRVAVSLADATGHGLPAALLTQTFQRFLRSPMPPGSPVDAADPSSVLAALNRELCHADLPGCQFLAGLYAVYDERTRALRWARGGLPYPILIRTNQAPRAIVSAGSLIGVDNDARFETVQLTLEPGDRLLFVTDGIEELLTGAPVNGLRRPLECHDWFRSLAQAPTIRSLRALEAMCNEKRDGIPDDITVVALHITARTQAPQSKPQADVEPQSITARALPAAASATSPPPRAV